MPQENQQSNVLSNVLGIVIGVFASPIICGYISLVFYNSSETFFNVLSVVQFFILISSIFIVFYKNQKSRLLSSLLCIFASQALIFIIIFQILKIQNDSISW